MIVKVGGGPAINVEGIIEDVAELTEPVIIVHGANAVRDEIGEAMGYPTKHVTSIKGMESVLSDEKAIDVLMMSYAGLRNKRIVELCQQKGVNAIGLTGLDGQAIRGERGRGIRVEENGKKKILRDFSGKPTGVNVGLFEMLLDAGYTPVICPPILDAEGFAINTQNDSIIATLVKDMDVTTIVDMFAERGLLENKDDPATLISALARDDVAAYIEKTDGRMRRKIHAMTEALDHGVERILFSDGRVEHPLRDALAGKGTTIQ